MSNPNPPSPLFEFETKELLEELSRRAPGGIYVYMSSPPVGHKPDDVCAGFYYKAQNVDGIAKIIGHTLMWFLGSRVMQPPVGTPPPPDVAPEHEESM
jgi:hypothetical protein